MGLEPGVIAGQRLNLERKPNHSTECGGIGRTPWAGGTRPNVFPVGSLDDVMAALERGRRAASAQANATLTMTYWLTGRAISVNLLRHQRADYGKQTVATLSRQLTARFGRGFELASLRRMVQFAEEVSGLDTVATVSRKIELEPSQRAGPAPIRRGLGANPIASSNLATSTS